MNSNATDVVPVAWRKHHTRLVQLRERVLEDTMDLSSQIVKTPAAFRTEQATQPSDSFDPDLAFGLLAFEEDALQEIDEALDRIRDGRYGVCELTGQPIPHRRLEAIPWARNK